MGQDKVCINNTYAEGDVRNDYITYAYNRFYSDDRLDMIGTWQHESDWQAQVISHANSNGTRDYGLCQLNSRYHLSFINSEEYKDPYKQLDYCISIYYDARKRNKPIGKVWYGWASRDKHIHKFECN